MWKWNNKQRDEENHQACVYSIERLSRLCCNAQPGTTLQLLRCHCVPMSTLIVSLCWEVPLQRSLIMPQRYYEFREVGKRLWLHHSLRVRPTCASRRAIIPVKALQHLQDSILHLRACDSVLLTNFFFVLCRCDFELDDCHKYMGMIVDELDAQYRNSNLCQQGKSHPAPVVCSPGIAVLHHNDNGTPCVVIIINCRLQ